MPPAYTHIESAKYVPDVFTEVKKSLIIFRTKWAI